MNGLIKRLLTFIMLGFVNLSYAQFDDLNLLYEDELCGLKYVQASECLHARSQNFTLPCTNPNPVILNTTFNGNVRKAYIFFTAVGPDEPPLTINFTFNGVNVVATYADYSGDATCWNDWANTIPYVAEVTNLVVNGNNTISGIPTSSVGPLLDANGVTLFVAYTEPCSTPDSKWGYIKIMSGLKMFVPYSEIVPFNCPNTPLTSNAFMILGDAETFNNTTYINGNVVSYTGNMHNFISFDNAFTGSPVDFTVGISATDCINMSIAGVYYTDNRSSCQPFSMQLSSSGSSCGASNGAIDVSVNGGVGPYIYTWIPNVSSTSYAQNLPTGTYSVLVTDQNGCADQETVTIVQTPPFPVTVNLGPDTLLCNGIGTTLCAPSGFSNYDWSVPGSCPYGGACAAACVSGQYCVTVTDANGCTAEDCINVTIGNPVNINISCIPVNPCPGEEFDLTALGCSSCNIYQWSNGQSGQSISDNINTNTTYTVTATDPVGCTGTASLTVEIGKDCISSEFCKYIERVDFFDPGAAIEQTNDGGFVIVGTMHENANDKDLYFARFDASFNLVSKRRIGENTLSISQYREQGYSVVVGPDAFFAIGEAMNYSNNDKDVFVARIDAATNSLDWAFRYGGSGDEMGIKGLYYESASGIKSLIITGGCNSLNGGNLLDVLVMKIDPVTGAFQSMNTFYVPFLSAFELGGDMVQVPGTPEFIITSRYEVNGNEDILCFKINDGLTLATVLPWVSAGQRRDAAFGIELIGNYAYIMGKTESWGSGNEDAFVMEINANTIAPTNAARNFHLSATSVERLYRGQKTSDDKLVMVGEFTDYDQTSPTAEGLIMKININPGNPGHLQQYWSLGMQDIYDDAIFNICESGSDHLLVTGTIGRDNTDQDIFISRLKDDFPKENTCCYKELVFREDKGFDYKNVHLDTKATSWTPRVHRKIGKGGTLKLLCETYGHAERESFGYDSESQNEDLVIFPNPNDGNFALSILVEDSEIESLKITDLSGRIIDFDITNAGTQFNITIKSGLPGLYFLTAQLRNGENRTTRFVLGK